MSKRKPFASQDYIETSLWNHGEVRYQTNTPGWLVIGDGEVKLRYRFDYDHGGNPERIAEGNVNIACYHRMTDSTGVDWEARACFSSQILVHRLLDLTSINPARWEHNDPERKKIIAKRPLLTGLQVVEDDRFYRRFWVNHVLLEIPFKYQGLTIDIGSGDNFTLVVRVSGFFGHWCYVPMCEEAYVPPWRGGTAPSPEEDARGKQVKFPPDETPGGDYENLAPIVYSLYVSELLFRNDGVWEEGCATQCSFPRPLIFSRVEEQRRAAKRRGKTKPAKNQNQPQPNVVFHSA